MAKRHVRYGFLYGHYDSRGGTIFIEAASQDEADKQYAVFFGVSDAEMIESLTSKDFLGAASLLAPSSLNKQAFGGIELDFSGDSRVYAFCEIPDGKTDGEFHLEPSDKVYLWHAPDGKPPLKGPFCHPRWDDDAFGFYFMPKSA